MKKEHECLRHRFHFGNFKNYPAYQAGKQLFKNDPK